MSVLNIVEHPSSQVPTMYSTQPINFPVCAGPPCPFFGIHDGNLPHATIAGILLQILRAKDVPLAVTHPCRHGHTPTKPFPTASMCRSSQRSNRGSPVLYAHTHTERHGERRTCRNSRRTALPRFPLPKPRRKANSNPSGPSRQANLPPTPGARTNCESHDSIHSHQRRRAPLFASIVTGAAKITVNHTITTSIRINNGTRITRQHSFSYRQGKALWQAVPHICAIIQLMQERQLNFLTHQAKSLYCPNGH